MSDQLPEGTPQPKAGCVRCGGTGFGLVTNAPCTCRYDAEGTPAPSEAAIQAAAGRLPGNIPPTEHEEWQIRNALRAAYAIDFPGRAAVGEPPSLRKAAEDLVAALDACKPAFENTGIFAARWLHPYGGRTFYVEWEELRHALGERPAEDAPHE